jgi:hypothetical protein
MTRIQDADARELKDLERRVQKVTRASASLEEALQRYTELIYQHFAESIVLARVFATGLYRDLPAFNRRFVDELARSKNIVERVVPDMLTLSLLGTSGVEPDWNDRRRSQSHIGIPLASAAFVDAIPMVARMLHELGLGFDWIDSRDTALTLKTLGSINGVFHVADATTAVDAQGRKIIPSQDFVRKYGIRSVLGVGGAYIGYPVFIVAILFCRDEVSREHADEFIAHIHRIKASTVDLVHRGQIFADEPAAD